MHPALSNTAPSAHLKDWSTALSELLQPVSPEQTHLTGYIPHLHVHISQSRLEVNDVLVPEYGDGFAMDHPFRALDDVWFGSSKERGFQTSILI